jgi:hypothetical protein
VTFVNVKMSVAIIGRKVNARNPMIHGEMKTSAQSASRRASPHRGWLVAAGAVVAVMQSPE